jgi:protein gp37
VTTKSSIEWTEHTWNPVTGCSELSPGCAFCYAAVFAARLRAMGVSSYANGFEVTLQPNRLGEPLRRIKPTVYFVNSMSDLFHDEVPFDFIDRVYDTMGATPQHRYQVLTKRPERLARFSERRPTPKNVWLGVSVENRRHGVPRIAELRAVSAPLRFLSVEPLLEDLGALDLTGVHWVIVGGESGPKARPMRPEWARRVRDQCVAAGIPFFFKQWGSVGADGVRRSKSGNGRRLDGREWRQMPA